jgi:hypothetical protein
LCKESGLCEKRVQGRAQQGFAADEQSTVRVNPDFPRLTNPINDIGCKAVHQGLLSEDEARACLQNSRAALQLLLRN